MAVEQLDLRDYDLVITSDAGPMKGVLVAPEAVHICYCHAPMRYIWNHTTTIATNFRPGEVRVWVIRALCQGLGFCRCATSVA